MISGPLIRKKDASLSFATARARRVLPVPGGPYSSRPLGGSTPSRWKQLGVAQRQLDHLAQLVDRLRHAADIVVGHVGAALRRLLIFGAQLHLGILVDVDDALGAGRHHRQADFLQRIGRRVHELLDARRHVADALVPRGRDDVALAQRPPEEGALQRCGWPCKRRLACAGAKTTRVAGFDSTFRTSTKSPAPTPALARCRPSMRRISIPSSSGYGRRRARASTVCRRSRSRRPRPRPARPSGCAAGARGRGRNPPDGCSPPGFYASGYRCRPSTLVLQGAFEAREIGRRFRWCEGEAFENALARIAAPACCARFAKNAQKKGRRKRQPGKVFRRGCLKGRPLPLRSFMLQVRKHSIRLHNLHSLTRHWGEEGPRCADCRRWAPSRRSCKSPDWGR